MLSLAQIYTSDFKGRPSADLACNLGISQFLWSTAEAIAANFLICCFFSCSVTGENVGEASTILRITTYLSNGEGSISNSAS